MTSWSRLVPAGPGWSRLVKFDPAWSRLVLAGPAWSRMVQAGHGWSRLVQPCPGSSSRQNASQWAYFLPISPGPPRRPQFAPVESNCLVACGDSTIWKRGLTSIEKLRPLVRDRKAGRATCGPWIKCGRPSNQLRSAQPFQLIPGFSTFFISSTPLSAIVWASTPPKNPKKPNKQLVD